LITSDFGSSVFLNLLLRTRGLPAKRQPAQETLKARHITSFAF